MRIEVCRLLSLVLFPFSCLVPHNQALIPIHSIIYHVHQYLFHSLVIYLKFHLHQDRPLSCTLLAAAFHSSVRALNSATST